MSYLDIGYDNFLDRSASFYPERKVDLEVDQLLSSVSSKSIRPDSIIYSANKALEIDLINGTITKIDGTTRTKL